MRVGYKWLALVVAMAFSAAGCGGTGEETEVPVSTAAPATSAAVTAVEDEPVVGEEPEPQDSGPAGTVIATDVGVDLEAGVIRVGMLADLTGTFGR